MTPLRPIPDDFLEVAPGRSIGWLKSHYNTRPDSIRRWGAEARIKVGGDANVLKLVPDDFPKLATKLSNRELQKHYNAGRHTVERWRRQCQVASPPRKPPPCTAKPIPPDFKDVAGTMPRHMLALHFGCGISTIQRWANESGISLKKGRRPGAAHFGWHKPAKIDTRDGSLASRAQSYLQRFYPVWRCDADGRFNPKGTHYRCDGITRTESEMIDRAHRKGFDENEWRRAA